MSASALWWCRGSLALCLLVLGLMAWDKQLERRARARGETPPYLKMGNLRMAAILMLPVILLTGVIGIFYR